MEVNKKNDNVNIFFSKPMLWKEELEVLRNILLNTELVEELKWGQPCYTFKGKNVILLGSFKKFCIISFLKGVLINDTHQILVQQGENTQSARVVPFTSIEEINKVEGILKEYIKQSIEIEKEGLTVEFKETAKYDMPEELILMFNENPRFKDAFEALTPGRQRGYILYFREPKLPKTRASRIEKYIDKILEGKGLHDWK